MTCIVAIVDENGIAHFAGDSLVVNVPSEDHSHVSQTVRKEPKIWSRNGMVFGANGAVRMLQLLRYQMVIPEYYTGYDRVTYLVTQFVPALQACFEENEYPTHKLSGNILLSLGGQLFTIGEQFHICDTANSYDSVGKSNQVAIGSLYTTEQLKLPPRKRLLFALQATERHTCVVAPPYMYISSEMDQTEILVE